VVFGRYLEERWKRGRVRLDTVSYFLGDVLVNEQDSDIFALLGKLVERGFDGCVLRLCVDNEEVLLGVWWLRDVLGTTVRSRIRASAVLEENIRLRRQVACLLPYPVVN
jgi:hypothetical protein